MGSQADFDFGNALVELDLAPLAKIREGLKTLKDSTRAGESLERILLESRIITPEQAAIAHRRLRSATQPTGAPAIPGYQILDVLGSGTAGTVYRAKQVSMDRIVALKILSPRLAQDRAYLDRFLREARSAARLSHPNLIVAHDVGDHRGTYYLVMEYVPGATLQQLLDRQGALEEARVIDVAIQIARALEVAQRHGMVHRDVKPANILLGSDGHAKLCDLGLAREGTAASEGRAVGTPRYISPEQAKDSPGIDIRSDLYSLGATMYHLVTGQVPFPAETGAQMLAKHVSEKLVAAHARSPKVSPELSAVISKLMEKRPDQRIQRPQDLIAALESIRARRARPAAAPAPEPSPAPAPLPRVMRPPFAYSRPGGGGSGKFFGVVLVLAIGAGAWYYRDKISAAFPSGESSPPSAPVAPASDPAVVEKAARQELDRIDEMARQDAKFETLDWILQKFDDFRRRHRGTLWETAAIDRRRDYLDRADVVARSELETIRAREGGLLAAGRHRDVYQLYARFPKRFLDTTGTGQIVKDELRELTGRISDQFTRDKALLQERVRERKYDEALDLLAAMELYALPDQVMELAERRRALEGLRKTGTSAGAVEVRDRYLLLDPKLRDAFSARRYSEAIKTLSDFLFGPWTESEKSFVRVAGLDYDALRKELEAKPPELAKVLAHVEAGMGDPGNLAEASTAQSILLDLRNSVSLELFKEQIANGLDRTAKATPAEVWTRTGPGGAKKGHYKVGYQWVPENGKPVPLDLWALAEVDLVSLAGRSYAADRAASAAAALADPVFHLRAGLLHLFARTGTAGAGHAEAHFKTAVSGGVKGVKVYLSDLSETLQKLAEQEAASRLEEAKQLIGQGQASTARSILEELAARKGVKFLDQHRAEIEKLLADIQASLTKGKRFEEAYRGKVETIDDKRIRVLYDFTDKAQGEMFEMVTLDGKLKGRWKSDQGCLESMSGTSVSSASQWRPLVTGDVEVEYDLVAMEEPQNIATDLFYRPGSGRYYAVTFGLDLAAGNMEELMRIPPTAVIKYPMEFQAARAKLPAEWEKIRSRLVGAPVADYRLEKKKKVRVKIARKGNKISVAVDGKPVWEGEDAEYSSGHLLFFSDCRAQIDNLAITFTP